MSFRGSFDSAPFLRLSPPAQRISFLTAGMQDGFRTTKNCILPNDMCSVLTGFGSRSSSSSSSSTSAPNSLLAGIWKCSRLQEMPSLFPYHVNCYPETQPARSMLASTTCSSKISSLKTEGSPTSILLENASEAVAKAAGAASEAAGAASEAAKAANNLLSLLDKTLTPGHRRKDIFEQIPQVVPASTSEFESVGDELSTEEISIPGLLSTSSNGTESSEGTTPSPDGKRYDLLSESNSSFDANTTGSEQYADTFISAPDIAERKVCTTYEVQMENTNTEESSSRGVGTIHPNVVGVASLTSHFRQEVESPERIDPPTSLAGLRRGGDAPGRYAGERLDPPAGIDHTRMPKQYQQHETEGCSSNTSNATNLVDSKEATMANDRENEFLFSGFGIKRPGAFRQSEPTTIARVDIPPVRLPLSDWSSKLGISTRHNGPYKKAGNTQYKTPSKSQAPATVVAEYPTDSKQSIARQDPPAQIDQTPSPTPRSSAVVGTTMQYQAPETNESSFNAYNSTNLVETTEETTTTDREDDEFISVTLDLTTSSLHRSISACTVDSFFSASGNNSNDGLSHENLESAAPMHQSGALAVARRRDPSVVIAPSEPTTIARVDIPLVRLPLSELGSKFGISTPDDEPYEKEGNTKNKTRSKSQASAVVAADSLTVAKQSVAYPRARFVRPTNAKGSVAKQSNTYPMAKVVRRTNASGRGNAINCTEACMGASTESIVAVEVVPFKDGQLEEVAMVDCLAVEVLPLEEQGIMRESSVSEVLPSNSVVLDAMCQDRRSEEQISIEAIQSTTSEPVSNNALAAYLVDTSSPESDQDVVSNDGTYPRRMGRSDYDTSVLHSALRNYEHFHGMQPGTAFFQMVQASSAGIEGWAAKSLSETDPPMNAAAKLNLNTACPKKYTKIDGVVKLTPEWIAWKEAQGGSIPAAGLANPSAASPVAPNMEGHEDFVGANGAVGGGGALPSESTTREMARELQKAAEARMQPHEMIDEFGTISKKHECTERSSTVDSVASMTMGNDNQDLTTNRNCNRWKSLSESDLAIAKARYLCRRKLKAAIKAIMAANRLHSLRKTFNCSERSSTMVSAAAEFHPLVMVPANHSLLDTTPHQGNQSPTHGDQFQDTADDMESITSVVASLVGETEPSDENWAAPTAADNIAQQLVSSTATKNSLAKLHIAPSIHCTVQGASGLSHDRIFQICRDRAADSYSGVEGGELNNSLIKLFKDEHRLSEASNSANPTARLFGNQIDYPEQTEREPAGRRCTNTEKAETTVTREPPDAFTGDPVDACDHISDTELHDDKYIGRQLNSGALQKPNTADPPWAISYLTNDQDKQNFQKTAPPIKRPVIQWRLRGPNTHVAYCMFEMMRPSRHFLKKLFPVLNHAASSTVVLLVMLQWLLDKSACLILSFQPFHAFQISTWCRGIGDGFLMEGLGAPKMKGILSANV